MLTSLATPPVDQTPSDPTSAFLLRELVFFAVVMTLVTLFVAWRVITRAEAERAVKGRDTARPPETAGARVIADPSARDGETRDPSDREAHP